MSEPSERSLTFHERLLLLLHEYDDDEPVYQIQLSPSQMMDLASGYVPTTVKAMCLASLDWREEDKRRAASSVRPAKTRRKTGG